MKFRIILYLISALAGISFAQAQELNVISFEQDQSDLSAQVKSRKDINGELCALVLVQLASDKAQFAGDIIGEAPEYKIGEYWVYMSGKDPEAKYLKVSVPGYLVKTVNFEDYKAIGSVKSGLTYVLRIEMPPLPAAPPAPAPFATSRPSDDSPSESAKRNEVSARINQRVGGGSTKSDEVPETSGATAETTHATNTITSEVVYESVEQMPSYPGGDAAMQQHINSVLRYPVDALEDGVQGRVTVKFVVNKDGSISQVKVAKGCHPALDKEAVRVVKTLGKFNPGKRNGQNVNVWFQVPVTFRLRR